jgi:succinoglycan biosynthesis protein ExoA
VSNIRPSSAVSIIVPCRNERPFIADCLESIIANDFPRDRMEVIVVDGLSDDGTRDIVRGFAESYSFIRLVDNPRRSTPCGLNVGILAARGEIVMRIDAHARIAPDYISRCVDGLARSGAENVGGVMHTIPQGSGLLGDAIVAALSHRFGVGNSVFRTHADQPTWVDTVFGGCYRREVFDRVGLFNESLARGQDMEFNRRLARAGGRTLLLPDVVSYYYARSDYRSFCRHTCTNGVWAIMPFAYSDVVPVSVRHLIPLLFVSSMALPAAVSLFWSPAVWAMVMVVAAYGVANIVASSQVASSAKRPVFLLVMPIIFATLHFAYGLGSLWGCCRLLGVVTMSRWHFVAAKPS